MKIIPDRPAIVAASAVVLLLLVLLVLIWLHSNAVQEWQILIAGMVALAAAFVGGAYITEQIRALNNQVNRQFEASQNLENERRLRKFAAARAVLPLTLNNLCEYASRCGAALKTMLGHQLDEKIPNEIEIPDLPTLPKDVIDELRNVVEFGDEQISEAAATLIGEIHYKTVRLKNLWQEYRAPGHHVTPVSNVESQVLDMALIYARGIALFDYARGETEEVPGDPRQHDVVAALNQIGFLKAEYQRIHNAASN
jgi:hypothetical protein